MHTKLRFAKTIFKSVPCASNVRCDNVNLIKIRPPSELVGIRSRCQLTGLKTFTYIDGSNGFLSLSMWGLELSFVDCWQVYQHILLICPLSVWKYLFSLSIGAIHLRTKVKTLQSTVLLQKNAVLLLVLGKECFQSNWEHNFSYFEIHWSPLPVHTVCLFTVSSFLIVLSQLELKYSRFFFSFFTQSVGLPKAFRHAGLQMYGTEVWSFKSQCK